MEKYTPPFNDWPEVARIVNQAGKNLKLRFGDRLLGKEDIEREVEFLGGYTRGGVLPTDYCYNRINKAPSSFCYHVFEWVERGRFKYLEPHYDYTGPILWKPRRAPEKKAGEWVSGVCHLAEDPRNA